MNRKFLRVAAAAFSTAALVSALALAGCSSSSTDTDTSADTSSTTTTETASDTSTASSGVLQIFAANSLEKALPEVQALYAEQTGVTFADTQFKASGDLVSQLQSGASADILITASTSTMDTAVENGSVAEDSVTDMFVNDLVVCAKTDSGITMSSLEDLATDSISSFALGDPATVPAGKYAAQSLESAGYCTLSDDGVITWTNDTVADKANAGADKVGTVASYVSEGQVDVGFVYSSDIFRYDGITSIFTVPSDMHKSIKYPGAVVSDSAQSATAQDFLNFCLTDAEAQKIFSEYGFELAA